jgi:hypothetical protein
MGPTEPSFLPNLFAAARPGWTVRPNDAGVIGHFTLTGRDPAPVRIDPAVLRRYLLRMLLNADQNRGIDEIVARSWNGPASRAWWWRRARCATPDPTSTRKSAGSLATLLEQTDG